MSSHEPSPRTTTSSAPRSRWTWAVALLAVAAMLSPVAWLLSRPAPDAGLPLAQAQADAPAGPDAPGTGPVDPAEVLPSPAERPPGPSVPPEPETPAPRPYGDVAVRDASLDALAAETLPAPARLVVPDLGVDAPVDGVGVEPDGSMVIPDDVARVGWYRFGAAPGAATGNTVLAGHVDGADQGPGVLFRLRGVEVGTLLTLVDAAGDEHVYEVVGRESITKDVLPVEEIFARDGEHRLVVVTCGGEFQPELRSYTDNVVVTAVPVAPA